MPWQTSQSRLGHLGWGGGEWGAYQLRLCPWPVRSSLAESTWSSSADAGHREPFGDSGLELSHHLWIFLDSLQNDNFL